MRLNAIRAQHKTIDNQAQDNDMAVNFSDVCAVVPAAGFGRRMQTECPKQYLSIGDKRILEHAVTALLARPRMTRVIIAISPGDARFAQLPLAAHPQITVVDGGAERAESVLAGIQAAGDAQWVLVHDAARPCLHQDDLSRLLDRKSTRLNSSHVKISYAVFC